MRESSLTAAPQIMPVAPTGRSVVELNGDLLRAEVGQTSTTVPDLRVSLTVTKLLGDVAQTENTTAVPENAS